MNKALLAALTVAAFGIGSSAWAATCVTNDPGRVGGASTSDATLALNGGAAVASDACYVTVGTAQGGNVNAGQLNTWFADSSTGSFMQIAKLEKLNASASGSYGGINFTLTPHPAGYNGNTDPTWDLIWSGGPATLDLVLAVHASDASGAFFFNDRDFAADCTGTGVWHITWLNGGDKVPGFSNMTLWARAGNGSNDNEPGPGGNLPLPGTALLLRAGMLAAGLRRKA